MSLLRLGLLLVFAGFAVVFAAALAIAVASILGAGEARFAGGGCVIIFFIPICFGYGDPPLLLMLAVTAVALVVVSYFAMREAKKAFEKEGDEQRPW